VVFIKIYLMFGSTCITWGPRFFTGRDTFGGDTGHAQTCRQVDILYLIRWVIGVMHMVGGHVFTQMCLVAWDHCRYNCVVC